MIHYSSAFYRLNSAFDDMIMQRTLMALHAVDRGFFPATLWTSKHGRIILEGPQDYRRLLIPDVYFIKPGVATLPLHATNGAELHFTETDDPRTMPGSLVLKLSDAVLVANRWSLTDLLAIYRAVVPVFNPDHGHLYDDAHRARPQYEDWMFAFNWRRVPTGLFWINYYGPEWARNIGLKRLDRLRSAVPVFEWLDTGGVLFAIQEEPYD